MTSFDRDIQLRALLKVASELESAISLCPYIEFEDVERLHELMSQVQEVLQTIRNEAKE